MEMKYNLAFVDYLKQDGVSNSQLKYLAESPKSFKHFIIERNEVTDTEAMKRGRAFHSLVLEPQLFEKEYVVMPKIKGCGPAGKINKELELGKNILWEKEEFNVLAGMKESIESHELASMFLKDTKNEVSLFWDKEINGEKINCKGRIDAIQQCGGNVALVDLKTTSKLNKFNNVAFDLKYHMQAAYYMDGYSILNDGIIPQYFVFIAVSTTVPYLCKVFDIKFDSEEFYLGTRDYMDNLEKYIKCSKSNNWDDDCTESFHLQAPRWYK